MTFFSLIFYKLSTIYHWFNEEVNCNPKKYLSSASMQIEFTTSTQQIEWEMPEKKTNTDFCEYFSNISLCKCVQCIQRIREIILHNDDKQAQKRELKYFFRVLFWLRINLKTTTRLPKLHPTTEERLARYAHNHLAQLHRRVNM